MTKQKIVIKVNMPRQRSRSHAMALAAKAQGVSSVGIAGGGDQLEVIGDGIDIFCLVRCLRKKFCHADIVKVEEVKDKKPEEKKPEEPKPCNCPNPTSSCRCSGYCYAPPPMLICNDEPITGGCLIL